MKHKKGLRKHPVLKRHKKKQGNLTGIELNNQLTKTDPELIQISERWTIFKTIILIVRGVKKFNCMWCKKILHNEPVMQNWKILWVLDGINEKKKLVNLKIAIGIIQMKHKEKKLF